jgi:hypothetical protein
VQHVSPDTQENEETAAGNLDEAEKTVPETAVSSLPNQTSPNQASEPVQHVSPDTQENEETAGGNLDEGEKTVPETAGSSLPNETSPNQTSEPVQPVSPDTQEIEETQREALDEAEKTVSEAQAKTNDTEELVPKNPIEASNVGGLLGDEINESSPKNAFAWEDHPEAEEPVFGAPPEQAQKPKQPEAPEAPRISTTETTTAAKHWLHHFHHVTHHIGKAVCGSFLHPWLCSTGNTTESPKVNTDTKQPVGQADAATENTANETLADAQKSVDQPDGGLKLQAREIMDA